MSKYRSYRLSHGRYFCGIVIAIFIGCILPIFSVQGAENPSQLDGLIRIGVEYDDNALRLESNTARQDFLSRYFGMLDYIYWHNANHYSLASVQQGAKIFLIERDADQILTQFDIGHRWRISDNLILLLDADIKDNTERVSRMDYHRGGARLGASQRWGSLRATVHAGWRYFIYKPNAESNHHGPHYYAALRYHINPEFDIHLSNSLITRLFNTALLYRENGEIIRAIGDARTRSDNYNNSRVGIRYQSTFILEANYGLSINRSNSYGQELFRHSISATLTTPFVFSTLLTLYGELQRTNYADEFLIDGVFIVDDENRNRVTAALARPLFKHWEVEGRYSLYLQEFGAGESYRRQTFLIAMAYIF